MATTMGDAADRARVLERFSDELAVLGNKYSPAPLGEIEPVSEAWAALRETVRDELEAARRELAAAA
jgi:hypothetical protein